MWRGSAARRWCMVGRRVDVKWVTLWNNSTVGKAWLLAAVLTLVVIGDCGCVVVLLACGASKLVIKGYWWFCEHDTQLKAQGRGGRKCCWQNLIWLLVVGYDMGWVVLA